ncbi:MAG: hypothetical protein WCX82_01340 [archaeon]|jgi:hypothetical protein
MISKNSEQSYREIILLIHPLFNLFLDKISRINFNNKEELLKYLVGREPLLINLKETVKDYAKIILKYKNKKGALFVLINPAANSSLSFNVDGKKVNWKNLPECQALFSIVNIISAFGRKELGERFVITNFSPEDGYTKLFSEKIYNKLDKYLEIRAFGEYTDGCVYDISNRVVEELQNREFRIMDLETLRDHCISLNEIETKLDKLLEEKRKVSKIKENQQKKEQIQKVVSMLNNYKKSKAK